MCDVAFWPYLIDRLGLEIPLGGVQLPMITTAGCVRRTLTMTGPSLNATVVPILPRRWLLHWLLHPLFSRTTKPIPRNLFMVPPRSSSSPGIREADTVLVVPRLRYSTILPATGMSLFGEVLGCTLQPETTHTLSLPLLLALLSMLVLSGEALIMGY